MIAVVIGIFVNIFEMTAFSGTNVIALMITNIVLILFFLLFVPFLQNSENSEQTLKKAKIFKYQKTAEKTNEQKRCSFIE